MRLMVFLADVTDERKVLDLNYTSDPQVTVKFYFFRQQVQVTTDNGEDWCAGIKPLNFYQFEDGKRRFQPAFLAGLLGDDCRIDIEVVSGVLPFIANSLRVLGGCQAFGTQVPTGSDSKAQVVRTVAGIGRAARGRFCIKVCATIPCLL